MALKNNFKQVFASGNVSSEKARMQQRNGTYEQFLADSGKYLPAEFQVVRSGDPRSGTGKGLYIAFEAGEAEQLMTYENAKTLINENTEEIQNELEADINTKIKEANTAISSANTATKNANTATKNANSATTAANEAAEKANEAAESIKDAVGIDDTAPYATKTYSSNKIEDMAQTNLLPEYMFSDMTKVRSNYEYVDKKLIIKDTQPTDTGVAYCHIEIDLKPNTNYTISWKSTRTGTAGGGVWINKKGGGATINKNEYNTLNGMVTFNTGEDDGARILFVGAGIPSEGGKAGDSATFWDIMLVEGNFAPYMGNVRDVVRYTADIYGRFQSVESGSVLDIKKSGIYYVFNAVTDKPTEQGGMLNVAYESDANRVYTFTGEGYAMWTRRFIGGKDSGWKNPLESEIKVIDTYSDLDDVCESFDISQKDYAAKELLQVLPRNICITFTCRLADTSVHKITDLPVSSGIVCVYTGKTINYNRIIAYGSLKPSDIYTYIYNSTIDDMAWEKMLSESDIANNFTSTDATKVAAAPTVKQLKEEIDELNGKTQSYFSGLNNISENSTIKEFTDAVIEKAFEIGTTFFPFKLKINADYSPTNKLAWFHGYISLQNLNYDYNEIGTIVAHNDGIDSIGRILVKSGGTPYIEWKNISSVQ